MPRRPAPTTSCTAVCQPGSAQVEFTFDSEPLPRYAISIADFRVMQRAFASLGLARRYEPPVDTFCAWCKKPMRVSASALRYRLATSRTGAGVFCGQRCAGQHYSWWVQKQQEKDPQWKGSWKQQPRKQAAAQSAPEVPAS